MDRRRAGPAQGPVRLWEGTAGSVHRRTGRHRRSNRVGDSVLPIRRSGSASRRSGCRRGPGIAQSDAARYRATVDAKPNLPLPAVDPGMSPATPNPAPGDTTALGFEPYSPVTQPAVIGASAMARSRVRYSAEVPRKGSFEG